jgi:cobalt-zinc-cadmium efflux system protein
VGAGHDHTQARAQSRSRLTIVLALVTLYMIAEVIGGLLTNSLALLADAGHMLSDAAALALALFALWIAQRKPKPGHTYGYYRAEILAAVLNAGTLLAIAVYIFAEAYGRLGEPPEVQGALMMAIATGGLLINLAGLSILNAGRKESLNVHGAWLHVFTDALGSIGAIAAGGLIWAFGWNWADPAASVVIGVLVLFSGWSLLKEAVSVLMGAAPGDIDVDEVRVAIKSVSGVEDVHDLHVWTITSGMPALSAHVVVSERLYGPEALGAVRQLLHERFSIDHVTVQLETPAFVERETLI